MWGVAATIIAASVAFPPTRPAAQGPPRALTAKLHDLTAVDQWRDTFDADRGKVRVLLLLSPT